MGPPVTVNTWVFEGCIQMSAKNNCGGKESTRNVNKIEGIMDLPVSLLFRIWIFPSEKPLQGD